MNRHRKSSPGTSSPLNDRWQNHFSPSEWQAGLDLQQAGAVLSCKHYTSTSDLDGEVRDGLEVFRVHIHLDEEDFFASCNCRRPSIRPTCKHMAAVMHHWLSPPQLEPAPRETGLSSTDLGQLEKIIFDWQQNHTLHEAHRLKLKALHMRRATQVETHLQEKGLTGLLEVLHTPEAAPETPAPAAQPVTSEPTGTVLEIGNLMLSLPRPPAVPPTQPRTERIDVPLREQRLVFALDPGKPGKTYPRLQAVYGTVYRNTVQDPKTYLPDRSPYRLTRLEEDFLQRAMDLKAQQRLRHTEATEDLLTELLESGRLYVQDRWNKPLDPAPPRGSEALWEDDGQGNQVPVFRTVPHARVLILSSVWYVDVQNLQMGQVLTDLQPHQLTYFMGMHPVAPEQVMQAREALRNVAGPVVPLPEKVEFERVVGTPEPHLRVSAREWSIAGIHAPVPQASLSVQYCGEWVDVRALATLRSTQQALPPIRRTTEHGLQVVERDLEAEKQLLETLTEHGFQPIKGEGRTELDYRFGKKGQFVPEHQWLNLLKQVLPALEQQGWKVQLDPSFPYRVLKEDLQAEIQDEEGWFTLDLSLELDGANISLLPVLLSWMDAHPEELQNLLEEEEGAHHDFLVVGPQTLVQVDLGRLRQILRLLREFYAPREGADGLRLPRMAAGLLEGLQDHPALSWKGGEEVLNLARSLTQMRVKRRARVPKNLQATLRPYQQEGVNWLQLLRKTGCNGILADDMGLGKTLQTLTHILMEKEGRRLKKPVLIVAPTSLMTNWMTETQRFTPTLRTLLLHGPARHRHFDSIKDADVVFTSYALMQRDIHHLSTLDFHTVILDEAQYIKNHKSQTTQAVLQIKSDHRLCLTGTPMENHLGELWSLFRFLMPGLLPKETEFRQFFRNPIERELDPIQQKRLSRMVRPLMLRRTKQQVARELPAKTEITIPLELEGPQRDVYDAVRMAMQERLRHEIQDRGLARSQIHVLDALLKLRQVCCDPRLLSLPEARKVTASVKMDWLKDALPDMLEEGRTVLIFSQFTTLLALLGDTLRDLGIEYALLTGDTQDRQGQVERFQSGEVKVFLVSLKAGGVGLNLTAADTVIHYDPWWNPAAENQATDRAYRIGQDKPVFVYKLVTTGTIEEKILGMQRFKAALAQGILEGTLGEGLRFSEEDLQGLLS